MFDLDVPTQQRPNKKGDIVRPLLENLMGSGTVPIVESPPGGRHYYLRLPDGTDPRTIRSRHKDLPGVDILRQGQYVVIAGSPHWQGGYYEWEYLVEWTEAFDRPVLNQNFLRLLTKDPVLESEPVETATISAGMLDDLLACLPVTNYREHAEWFAVMAAAHHATGGSSSGLDSFLAWSLSDAQYAEDGDKIAHRWHSLNAHVSRGYTLGTLFHECRRNGREDMIRKVGVALDFIDPLDPEPETISPPREDRIRIEDSTDEFSLNSVCIKILAEQPQMYARLDQLWSMEIQNGQLFSRRLDNLGVCEMLSRYAEFGDYAGKMKKWKGKKFPARTGTQIANHESWPGMKSLRRVSPMPIMTQLGVHQQPGFEPKTGLFYFAEDMESIPVIPKSLSKSDAQYYMDDLLDLVEEFPWQQPAHKAAWFASLFGVVARPILGPCAPMTVIDGNRAGAGKGMLADIISDICLSPGQYASKFMGLDKSEDEQRKVFLSLARENPIIGIFDNFKSGGSIGSPVLDAILTTGHVNGRLLGLSKIIHAVFDTVLFATANRIQIDPNSDLLRRILYILLETPSEAPEKRTFKYPELRAHVQRNRGRYLAAAISVMEAARQNQDDLPTVSPWGSYSGFDLVRRAIVWMGLPDPRESVDMLAERHQGATELSIVISALESIGVEGDWRTSREIWDLLSVDEFEKDTQRKELLENCKQILVPQWGRHDPARAIGTRLCKHYRDQVSNGMWLRSSIHPTLKCHVFRLERVNHYEPEVY